MLTPGLDRNTEMQKYPVGTFSALRRPSPVASQYRRQSEMYGQALRNLSRAARRGDAKAGIEAVDLLDKAGNRGFSPGGIGSSEDKLQAISRREQDYGVETQNLERKNTLNRSSGDSVISREPMGPPSSAQNTRTSAGLDMLEGGMGMNPGGNDQLSRGRNAAASLGVQDPDSILSGDRNLKYRQTLDSALGQAKTPEEVATLKERGTRNGISSKAFDRRKQWWDSNR